MSDEHYMKMALSLATIGAGRTEPNPIVGAVLVKGERVVGFGAHLEAGKPHAEVHALQIAGEEARGATAYVTLEPCAHHGRTPPCADALIAAGVRRVVIALIDPFPAVSGRGIARLQAAGVEVSVGCLAEEALLQNPAFFHYARTGYPFVTLKLAASLDGKIAGMGGSPLRLTGSSAQERTHELRNTVGAIAVGVGTVLSDDPLLTTRLETGGRNPLRAVFDTDLRTPLSARIVTDRSAPTVLFCAQDASESAAAKLEAAGIEIIRLPRVAQGISLDAALRELARRGLTHVLIEGGGTVAAAVLRERLVQRVWMFYAPLFVGDGAPAIRMDRLPDGGLLRLTDTRVEVLGEDVLITGAPQYEAR